MFRGPRDTSGPMDVDDSHPLGRIAEYAIDTEEPARKRPHTDLSNPSPSNPFASAQNYRFGPNTPFLFHAPPLPPAPTFRPYDPNQWANTDFGFGTSSSAGAVDVEVDMDGHVHAGASGSGSAPGSPARPAVSVSASHATAAAPANPPPDVSEAADDERPIAVGAVARVRRRRMQQARVDDDDEDAPGPKNNNNNNNKAVSRRRGRNEHTYNLHMNAPAVHHSEIPAILLGYVQFVFNASLVVGFLYVASQFILAVRRDVQERIEEYSVEILQEIAQCTQAYFTNRCDPNLRVPAMEQACSAWEMCMNRDPKVVGRARVGAETFAGVINSFVDPISWKTMGFTLVTLTFLIILTNSALFNLRAKHQHQHQQQPPVPTAAQQQAMMYGYHPMMGLPGMPQQQPGMQLPPGLQGGGDGGSTGGKALGWLKKW